MLKNNFSLLNFFIILISILFLSNFVFAVLNNGEINIFAVTDEQIGVPATLRAYTIDGDGQVAFITSKSLVGKDTQTTGNISLKIAQEKANVLLSNKSLIYDIVANASEVDGPSAGAAMALLSYSMLSEKKLPKEVGITGTINSDGSIGAVGGVYPKAKAAANIGIKLFMIPKGEALQVTTENNHVTSINLLSYGPEKLGLKIVEVSNIDEVINYAYSDFNTIEVNASQAYSGFTPDPINYSSNLFPMVFITEKTIDQTIKDIKEAKNSLEISTLDESKRSEYYPYLGIAERNIELAKIYLDQNYLYSAANYAFNASVIANTINEIALDQSILLNGSSAIKDRVTYLRSQITDFKKYLNFIPINNYEWIVGSQQRLAYSENALNKLSDFDYNSIKNLSNSEKEDVYFNLIYEYYSAKNWFMISRNFYSYAKTDKVLKEGKYSTEFINQVKNEINDINNQINSYLLGDLNSSQSNSSSDGIVIRTLPNLTEINRRLNAALISIDNGFYYAALFDTYFSKSFFESDVRSNSLIDKNNLNSLAKDNIDKTKSIESIWANLYRDHAIFYYQDANYELSLGQKELSNNYLSTVLDLTTVSLNLDYANKLISKDILTNFATLKTITINDSLFDINAFDTDYKSNNSVNHITIPMTWDNNSVIDDDSNLGIGVSINTIKSFNVPFFAQVLIALLALVLVLIFILSIGSKSTETNHLLKKEKSKKIHKVLSNLDKAVVSKKISSSEYMLLKEKYTSLDNNLKKENEVKSNIFLDLLTSFNLTESNKSKTGKFAYDENTDLIKGKAKSEVSLKSKLAVLEKTVNDLENHYSQGLILDEDYVSHFNDLEREIKSLKNQISLTEKSSTLKVGSNQTKFARVLKDKNLTDSNLSNLKKTNDAKLSSRLRGLRAKLAKSEKVKGTSEKVEEEEKEAEEEKASRKRLIEASKRK
ncbi:MAG: hypothetical protein PHQ98_03930 [Candidatus ainarchaeum sp.]|nr:hypothetical protein [Candidatus ainarchaeum sp.]